MLHYKEWYYVYVDPEEPPQEIKNTMILQWYWISKYLYLNDDKKNYKIFMKSIYFLCSTVNKYSWVLIFTQLWNRLIYNFEINSLIMRLRWNDFKTWKFTRWYLIFVTSSFDLKSFISSKRSSLLYKLVSNPYGLNRNSNGILRGEFYSIKEKIFSLRF